MGNVILLQFYEQNKNPAAWWRTGASEMDGGILL